MGLARNLLKKIYYTSVALKKRARNSSQPTARILIYHRIADVKDDPHRLCVSPSNFQEQMRYLKENFNIIPLVKLVQDIRNKKIQNNSMVITFDDGYVDNLHNALPVLEKFNIPATIFLTSDYIGLDKPFYWDENTTPEYRGRPMTTYEAKKLSSSRLIEIGGHTASHPKLATLPETDQSREINEGKKRLEEILGIPLLSFAYPFGGKDSFDDKTIALVKKAGYHYACANIHERATNNSNIFALPRFIIRNWHIEALKENIQKFT
jgi:peptidoglycan/xylan/chitin deacetylase (PgdA/CDA1 family)